jgi:hypothetical protein
MRNSKNNIFLAIFFFILQACSTKPLHQVVRQGGELGIVEIITTPDRVLPYCEEIDTSPGRYGFMVLILDEENTVGGGSGMMSSLKGCRDWEVGVWKVLKKGRKIRIVGTGRYDETRIKERFTYTFPGHGTFHSNGRSFGLTAITNEHQDCFGMFSRKCSGGDYPLEE